MLLEVLIVGNVIIGPNLCKVDAINKGQLYTIEYVCKEDGRISHQWPGNGADR
jgi:hypothetical protein